MNIVEKVQAINEGIATVKADFQSALQNKGVTVSTDLKLKDYPELVKDIQVGIEADLTNLSPENIKSGVTINGVTGNFTSDATAYGSVLREGYTAYVNGQRIYGEMPNVGLYQDGYLTVAINSGYSAGGYLTLSDSNLQSKNILSGVSIFGVYGSIDLTNLNAENIKNGVTINGITGTLAQGAEVVVSETEPANPTEGMIWIIGTAAGGGTDEPSDGGSTSNADYIVSGAIDYPEINGDYVQDGEYNGKPKYVNTTSNATYTPYMQCDSMVGWAIFYPNQPRAYTNDTTSDTPPTTGWNNGVTVTKGGGSNSGSTSKQTLVVSGFRMTEAMDYYSVSSLNGEYVIDDTSKTGYDRTWTNPDNGVTLLYRSSWGYWGFSNSYNSTGGDIYTYGENPYNADGSSTQWQERGADSVGQVIVKS